MRTLVLPVFRSLTLREIGVARCDHFIKQLAKLSHSGAKQGRVVLRLALELAVRHEILPSNPMDHVSRLYRGFCARGSQANYANGHKFLVLDSAKEAAPGSPQFEHVGLVAVWHGRRWRIGVVGVVQGVSTRTDPGKRSHAAIIAHRIDGSVPSEALC